MSFSFIRKAKQLEKTQQKSKQRSAQSGNLNVNLWLSKQMSGADIRDTEDRFVQNEDTGL